MRDEKLRGTFALELLKKYAAFQRQDFEVTKWDNNRFLLACNWAENDYHLIAHGLLEQIGDRNVIPELLQIEAANDSDLWELVGVHLH